VSPFSDELTKLTDAQILWVIRMFKKDNPDLIKDIPAGPSADVLAKIEWAKVLTGKGRQKLYSSSIPAWKREQLKQNGNSSDTGVPE